MAKTCNGCKDADMAMVTMSSADWQRNEQRHERRDRRHWILHIIFLALFVGSNIAWLAYESQFETVETTEEYQIEQDAENGNNNSIINGGEIVNGEAKDNIQENNENP